ncbi:MAG: hypothetical protein ACLQIJ_22265 [Polyangia bacterium]
MAVHPNTLKNLIPFKPGQSGNPGGKPGKGRVADWQEFARGVPLDDATGEPVIHPDTGEPATRDDLVMQATFRAAVDIKRKDCTRAQQTWNAYVRGTPRQTVAMDVTSNGEALGGQVHIYLPDNGRGPHAEDVKPPAPADAPSVTVPESDGTRERN